MSVTKPARWAVSSGLVDPQWRWAWRGLDLYLPLDGSMSNVAGQSFSSNPPSGLSWVVSPAGLALRNTGTETTANPLSGYRPPGDETDAPFTVVHLTTRASSAASSNFVVSTYPGSGAGWATQLETWENTGKVGFTKIAVVDIASTIDTPTGMALCVYSINLDNTVDFYVYDYATASWAVDESQANNQAWNPGGDLNLLADGAASDVDLAMVAIWRRLLSSEERDLLARDPFGPIRPAQGFSRDATWQDLNPTLRAIPGAADGP